MNVEQLRAQVIHRIESDDKRKLSVSIRERQRQFAAKKSTSKFFFVDLPSMILKFIWPFSPDDDIYSMAKTGDIFLQVCYS